MQEPPVFPAGHTQIHRYKTNTTIPYILAVLERHEVETKPVHIERIRTLHPNHLGLEYAALSAHYAYAVAQNEGPRQTESWDQFLTAGKRFFTKPQFNLALRSIPLEIRDSIGRGLHSSRNLVANAQTQALANLAIPIILKKIIESPDCVELYDLLGVLYPLCDPQPRIGKSISQLDLSPDYLQLEWGLHRSCQGEQIIMKQLLAEGEFHLVERLAGQRFAKMTPEEQISKIRMKDFSLMSLLEAKLKLGRRDEVEDWVLKAFPTSTARETWAREAENNGYIGVRRAWGGPMP